MVMTAAAFQNVTAVLPYPGPVDWPLEVLDAKAAEWLRDHCPTAVAAWRIPLMKFNDVRACTTCPNIAWQQCQYVLWARFWQAHRRSRGVQAVR